MWIGRPVATQRDSHGWRRLDKRALSHPAAASAGVPLPHSCIAGHGARCRAREIPGVPTVARQVFDAVGPMTRLSPPRHNAHRAQHRSHGDRLRLGLRFWLKASRIDVDATSLNCGEVRSADVESNAACHRAPISESLTLVVLPRCRQEFSVQVARGCARARR